MVSKDLEQGKKDRFAGHRDEKGRLIPGHGGGPGRKKGSVSIVRKVRQILAEHPEKLDKIATNLVDQAAAGKPHALGFLREILDRIDGPVQKDVAVSLPQVKEGITLEDRPTRARDN